MNSKMVVELELKISRSRSCSFVGKDGRLLRVLSGHKDGSDLERERERERERGGGDRERERERYTKQGREIQGEIEKM